MELKCKLVKCTVTYLIYNSYAICGQELQWADNNIYLIFSVFVFNKIVEFVHCEIV